jgi:Kef-type K+ transport system membrane component KefB
VTLRLALIVAIGSFMWAARSFMPEAFTGEGVFGLTLALGFVLLVAFFSGQVVAGLGLPKLTGYIAAGVIAGPAALDLVSEHMVHELQLVNGVAVSFIALTAGGELNFRRMRPLLRSIGWITLIAGIGTTVLLTAVVYMLGVTPAYGHEDGRTWLPFIAPLGTLGSIAAAAVLGITISAMSPAVVIAVRSETNAEGPVTHTVLGVVVIGDLLVIALFALVSAACRAILHGTSDVGETAGSVAWVLFGSMGAGLIVGLVLLLYLSKVGGSGSLFLVAVCVAIAEIGARLELDPLICALTAGVLVENASTKGHQLLADIAGASTPLYVVFFAVAGASIHLDVIPLVAVPAGVLVLTRAAGFLGGTHIAARIAGAPDSVARWAGFGLLPQAGLAIALALLFAQTFPEFGADAAALTLGIVAINEIAAPIFFRRALVRAGETRPDPARASVAPPPPAEDTVVTGPPTIARDPSEGDR